MTVRRPTPDEMPTVYLLGYDEWGEGRPVDRYLADCKASPKYARGTWYVFEHDDEPVAALICYQNAFGLPAAAVGIGSVATAVAQRRNGYASHLVREVMAHLRAPAYFLFSDVDPVIYEKLGFVRLKAEHQTYDKSVAMACPAQTHLATAPSYF